MSKWIPLLLLPTACDLGLQGEPPPPDCDGSTYELDGDPILDFVVGSFHELAEVRTGSDVEVQVDIADGGRAQGCESTLTDWTEPTGGQTSSIALERVDVLVDVTLIAADGSFDERFQAWMSSTDCTHASLRTTLDGNALDGTFQLEPGHDLVGIYLELGGGGFFGELDQRPHDQIGSSAPFLAWPFGSGAL